MSQKEYKYPFYPVNGNDPVNPCIVTTKRANSLRGLPGQNDRVETEIHYYGLTKREHIASIVLQGIVTNSSRSDPGVAASKAVKFTDALLKELNKQQTKQDI